MAVHFIGEEGVGSIQRVFVIDGKIVEQASKKEFLADLPVTEAFMADIRKDEESWKMIQATIGTALSGRSVKYVPVKWAALL